MVNPLRNLATISRLKVFILTSETTSGFDSAFEVTYAQSGEDISFLTVLTSNCQGSHIEIGAYHPSRFSVTRLLYEKG
jgi:hypothetical protein